MSKRIVATIEARMTSSRLPGKPLLEVLDRSMLAVLVTRLQAAVSIDQIVLATTTNSTDDPLVAEADKLGIACFRGSEEDVMQRVIDAAISADAEIIVEITGDCPLIDPEIVEQCIRIFRENTALYVGNAHVRSYPDGMDVQVFSLETLQRSAAMTSASLDHEHVTLHIRNHPEIFPAINVVAPPALYWPELGLTLDEAADFQLLSRIIEALYPQDPFFSCYEILSLLRRNSYWVALNQAVIRKGDS
jgi:spore coat polysaccharide biosynthesis protein SpsF